MEETSRLGVSMNHTIARISQGRKWKLSTAMESSSSPSRTAVMDYSIAMTATS